MILMLKAVGSHVIRAVRRWEIIDPRLKILRYAFTSGLVDVQASVKQYHLKTMTVLPMTDEAVKTMKWKLPNEEGMERLYEASDNVVLAVARVEQWIQDAQVILQNLLMGELFETALPTRDDPEDEEMASFKVLRLDRCDELVQYFENETEWGKERRALEERDDLLVNTRGPYKVEDLHKPIEP